MPELCDSIVTFGQLFHSYMDYHARRHCKRWADSQRMFLNYLKPLCDMPAQSIRRFDVQRLHADLGERIGQTTANRVVQLIRTVYNRAADWELIDRYNPAVGIKLYRLKPRERFLSESEIERFFLAIGSLRYETTRDFLVMCLLTAARRTNVAMMRWEHVDLNRGLWYLPDTKNGSSQWLPLTTMAVQILMKRKQRAAGEWVFPSDRSDGGHITRPCRAWAALIARADLKGVRIHDLRRTLASYEAMTGANLLVIANTLNHKDLKSVQIYGRLQVDPVRAAMETATRAMFATRGNTR